MKSKPSCKTNTKLNLLGLQPQQPYHYASRSRHGANTGAGFEPATDWVPEVKRAVLTTWILGLELS